MLTHSGFTKKRMLDQRISKVDVSKSVTYLKLAHVYGCIVIRCGFMNGHKKNVFKNIMDCMF